MLARKEKEMSVVLFSAQAKKLRVEYWFDGPGQAHYTCWLKPRGTPPGTEVEPFIDKKATKSPAEKMLDRPAVDYDGATLKVKVSCTGEKDNMQTLYFNVYDDTSSSRIGGFGDGSAPFNSIKITGNQLDDYCDKPYLLRVRA
jgi:hypothetical protein